MSYRLNNVEVAKGALYSAKSLAWASYLPLYRQAILRSGLVEESQAPPDLQDFISKHKFGQRNKLNGDPQEVNYTHQVMFGPYRVPLLDYHIHTHTLKISCVCGSGVW